MFCMLLRYQYMYQSLETGARRSKNSECSLCSGFMRFSWCFHPIKKRGFLPMLGQVFGECGHILNSKWYESALHYLADFHLYHLLRTLTIFNSALSHGLLELNLTHFSWSREAIRHFAIDFILILSLLQIYAECVQRGSEPFRRVVGRDNRFPWW